MMNGVASAMKALNPKIRFHVVETLGAASLAAAFEAGKPIEIPLSSKARTLSVAKIPERNFDAAVRYVEGRRVNVVTDEEAEQAQQLLLDYDGINTELAASCTVAALNHMTFPPNAHVVVILCGGPERSIQHPHLLEVVNYSPFVQATG